jgi:hypothetical protein
MLQSIRKSGATSAAKHPPMQQRRQSIHQEEPAKNQTTMTTPNN